jgi:hypothetical protein
MTLIRAMYMTSVLVLWNAPRGTVAFLMLGISLPFAGVSVSRGRRCESVEYFTWPTPWRVWRDLDQVVQQIDTARRSRKHVLDWTLIEAGKDS